ncbi:MAG: ankyrin repeat domain-containing protein, partial [archaeon]|nr:ankyrin repeat domain-containing protein [archaeon]
HQQLYYAVVRGDLGSLERLVGELRCAGEEPFRVDPEFHNTPLHYAAKYGRSDVVALLIAQGHPVDVPENDGWTPLHWASNNDKQHAVAQLLQLGADPFVRNKQGLTPRDMAPSAFIKSLLPEAGFKLKSQDSNMDPSTTESSSSCIPSSSSLSPSRTDVSTTSFSQTPTRERNVEAPLKQRIVSTCTFPSLNADASSGYYVTYKLVSLRTVDMKTFCSAPHRYNEFLSLWTDLSRQYPHLQLPEPPPGDTVIDWILGGRLQPQFVEKRRSDLDCWIRALLRMPQLCTTQRLLRFLDIPAEGANFVAKPAPSLHMPLPLLSTLSILDDDEFFFLDVS